MEVSIKGTLCVMVVEEVGTRARLFVLCVVVMVVMGDGDELSL